MTGFPKGLQVLVVEDAHTVACGQPAASALQNPELGGYCVTAVDSLVGAQQCFEGGAVAYDCVVCDFSLLACAAAGVAPAFFRAAASVHAPVVLMGERPSQAAVLRGVHWGAADFLEKPLSMLKLRTLWQHKIRKMMAQGNGGVLPRPASSPHLPPSSPHAACAAAAAAAAAFKQAVAARSGSLPGVSCPATPSLRSASLAAPQTTETSLASGDSAALHRAESTFRGLPAAAGDGSDATSGGSTKAAGPPAPLACLRLGAPEEALPAAVVHWPALPVGTTWGTPVGCGVAPPPLPGASSVPAPPPAEAAFPQPSIKWCPPGSLPLPATTNDLLLPDNFSLAAAVADACEGGSSSTASKGPLGLRLTVTPDLVANCNMALAPQRAVLASA